MWPGEPSISEKKYKHFWVAEYDDIHERERKRKRERERTWEIVSGTLVASEDTLWYICIFKYSYLWKACTKDLWLNWVS